MNDLPPSAKRVFKGMLLEVYQWEQKMFDGSTRIFERVKRPNTAQVIPIVGEKILIIRQQQPGDERFYTGIPGGQVDNGENPENAARRELLEETGYTTSSDFIFLNRVQPSAKLLWTVYTYIAHKCVRVSDPRPDAGEKITQTLVTFDEFLMLSEDKTFYERELLPLLLKARYDQAEREKLSILLFGKGV